MQVAHGNDDKGRHPGLRIIGVLFYKPRIDDEHYAVNSDASFSNICCQHHLPCTLRSGLKDLGLHVAREIRVDWAYDQFFDFVTKSTGSFLKVLVSCFNFVLARQEYKDVAFRLCRVNLEDCCDSSVEIIRLGLRSVMKVNRISTTWNCAHIELMQYSCKK